MCVVSGSGPGVPEAIAFSFIAGVDPYIGLTTSWILCLLASFFGDTPGMISGATGAIAILIGDLIKTNGIEALFYTVILMGIIQIILVF